MDKKKYWVSVGGQEIVSPGEGTNYEFEIEATQEELNRLKKLLDETNREANRPHGSEQAAASGREQSNRNYEERLTEVYRLIYDLGIPRTKEHIEYMHVL